MFLAVINVLVLMSVSGPQAWWTVSVGVEGTAAAPRMSAASLSNWTWLLNVTASAMTNVTSQVGDTVYLSCPSSKTDESPVWIRRKDYYILSGGSTVYIGDARMQVLHRPLTNDWTLKIKFVSTDDQGVYECQITTNESYRSVFVRLQVLQPVATIVNGVDYFVQRGTTIRLVCVIEGGTKPPDFVFWFHGERMINFDHERGGITVLTDTFSTPADTTTAAAVREARAVPHRTVSRLTISDAGADDSGNYSCKSSNANASFVHVYVSLGDNTAAIQRVGNGVSRRVITLLNIICLLSLASINCN